MLIDEFLCKREVLGKRAPHSFTPTPPPLSVVGVSNIPIMYFRYKKNIKGVIIMVWREVVIKEVPKEAMNVVMHEDIEEGEGDHCLASIVER
jgi:hypothetical protein